MNINMSLRANKAYCKKAFTVQELVVSLVISSIIIGMMYTLYIHVNKQLIGYNDDQRELMIFNQFRQVLCKDVLLATHIELNNTREFTIVFPNDSYSYRITKNSIIRNRNNGFKDTFNLEVTQIELTNDKVEEMSVDKAIRLHTRLMGEEIILFEGKTGSNANRINEFYLNEH